MVSTIIMGSYIINSLSNSSSFSLQPRINVVHLRVCCQSCLIIIFVIFGDVEYHDIVCSKGEGVINRGGEGVGRGKDNM